MRRGISRAEYGPRPLAGRLIVPPKCRLSVIASLPRRDSTSVAGAGSKQGTCPLSSSSPLYCVARERERTHVHFRVASSSLDRGPRRRPPRTVVARRPGVWQAHRDSQRRRRPHLARSARLPDLDSVTYALAGIWDSERGWGLQAPRGHESRAQVGHGLSGADNRGGRVRCWGFRVQVAEDEDRAP
jgi:hypothetical protein